VSGKDDDMATQVSSSRLPVHSLDTAITPTPTRRRISTPSIGMKPGSVGGSNSTTIGSPLEALDHDEIMRTRLFCLVALCVAFAGGGAALVLPGDPTISALLLASVGVALVAIIFLYMRTHDPIAFRRPSTSLGWFVPAACVTTSIPYFGVFSPVPVVLVLGVYFTGLGKSWRLSMAVYAVLAGMQALVAILVIGGARDTGIVQPASLSKVDEVIIQVLVQVVLLATIFTARMSRRTALVAVGELERAVRVAAHREALLLEAREELERALRQGRGRFSDQTIGGYHLGQLLGRGAMGEVYAAQRERDWTPLAMKILAPHLLSDTVARERFLRETAIVSSLSSPHVVKVVAVSPADAPLPYIVMERLTGTDLGQLLKKRPLLPMEDIVQIVAHTAKGLDAAHKAGVIHRDLKPTNIYAQGEGADRIWKILDFGASKWRDGDGTLTQDNIVGTPGYMAPEQALGRPIDARSDVYALGVILYRLLTGVPAVVPGEIPVMLQEVSFRMPVQPSKRANVAPTLEAVLAVALAKSPVHRFATAGELAYAFEEAAMGRLDRGIAHRAVSLLHDLPWGAWQRQ
jgi:serine/threonine-protein kinase